MPRIDPVPRGALGDLKTVLDAVESRMGFVPNSQLILAHRPEIVRAFAQPLPKPDHNLCKRAG